MPSEKYLKYGRPVEPRDPNQEYMTVQETAFTLYCSVDTIRRLMKELGLHSRPGRSIVTDKADRQAIHRARHAGRKTSRRKPLARAA
ncbi:DNA-binding protein [Streptomyces goshikiensis]|uniref:DNA-binding protein n=1 Tax=Streptomyces goshikiensis TaxID=1942 RepID=UPI002E1365A0|nr:DNA-binding protein [Streptomyces goshikiensis]